MEALLEFMGASGPQPVPDSESTHIYKLDPEGYFGEEASFSCKREIEIVKHESLCENPSGAHSDSKIVKIKSVSSSENLAIQAPWTSTLMKTWQTSIMRNPSIQMLYTLGGKFQHPPYTSHPTIPTTSYPFHPPSSFGS